MIVGIDPSFSRTGVCIAKESGEIVKTCTISSAGHCYGSIAELHNACESICSRLVNIIAQYEEKIDVVCEYPVFQSRSSMLAVLNGYLACSLRKLTYINSITWVGPQHCDSFIANRSHSKTFIVDYCKQRGWITKKTTHDECTAIIFVKLLLAIRDNRWKHSYFTWYR